MLDVGCWTLDVGRWTLDVGRWMLDVGCWVLGVGRWVLDVGCWTLGVGRWTLDVGRWVLDVGCWTLGVGRWVLDVGCWTLGVGRWMLDVQLPVWASFCERSLGKSLACSMSGPLGRAARTPGPAGCTAAHLDPPPRTRLARGWPGHLCCPGRKATGGPRGSPAAQVRVRPFPPANRRVPRVNAFSPCPWPAAPPPPMLSATAHLPAPFRR